MTKVISGFALYFPAHFTIPSSLFLFVKNNNISAINITINTQVLKDGSKIFVMMCNGNSLVNKQLLTNILAGLSLAQAETGCVTWPPVSC